jgi:putative endonuclease
MNAGVQGRTAEDFACQYLQRQGLALLQRNFRSRYGEIDLIMRDRKTVVFVEVKLRSRDDYGGAAAAVTPRKQQRLVKTALYYLQQHPAPGMAMRFDVIAIKPTAGDEFPIEWLQNVIEQQD